MHVTVMWQSAKMKGIGLRMEEEADKKLRLFIPIQSMFYQGMKLSKMWKVIPVISVIN